LPRDNKRRTGAGLALVAGGKVAHLKKKTDVKMGQGKLNLGKRGKYEDIALNPSYSYNKYPSST